MKGHHIISLSRLLGFFPFDYLGNFNPVAAFWGFCITASICVIHSARFIYDHYVMTRFKIITFFIGVVLYICSIFSSIIHLYVMVKNRRKLIFLADLHNENIKHPTSMIYLLICGTSMYVLSSSVNCYANHCTGVFRYLAAASDLCAITDILIVVQYSSILKLLKANFRLIRSTSDVDRHDYLILVSMTINSLYGRQLLAFFIGLLVGLTVEAFNVIFWISQTSFSQLTCLRHLLVIVFLVTVLLYVCGTCSSTCSEAEAFNHELFRMMRANDRLCNNKKLHLYVTMKQTVEFTACGFFKLGYPLVTSIIAAATTYLVILIQFSFPKASA